ncbi:hypothetical protein [Streptomyces jumonjinensis]|uniref:Uncharacterized protein n=1 Tax=Streptomyces jumonjinensis TaxID=1945 RepID=A0A646KCV1_STRJU|nr:hypothetical protein [Streptomyces jumonjinensis]MQS99959.1 hypothetical protein [Streptomyces jumonjinensis]
MSTLTTLLRIPPDSGAPGTVLPWRSLASLGIDAPPTAGAGAPADDDTAARPDGARSGGGAPPDPDHGAEPVRLVIPGLSAALPRCPDRRGA